MSYNPTPRQQLKILAIIILLNVNYCVTILVSYTHSKTRKRFAGFKSLFCRIYVKVLLYVVWKIIGMFIFSWGLAEPLKRRGLVPRPVS